MLAAVLRHILPGELPSQRGRALHRLPPGQPLSQPGEPAPFLPPQGLGNACRFASRPLNTELRAPSHWGFVWNLKHLLKLMTKNVRCVHS